MAAGACAAADDDDDCCVSILVGSVVETVSIADFPQADEHDDNDDAPSSEANAAAAAIAELFAEDNDDVSAGVWVVVRAAVTFAAVVTIFEHIVDPSIDGVQNVFSLSALGEETST